MRKVILFTALVVALAALAVLLPGSAQPAAGGTDLPFMGSFAGTTRPPSPPGQIHLVVTAEATHFGLGTNALNGYVIPIGPGLFHAVITDWTLTAANGDQMSGSGGGTVSTTDGVHFLGSWVLTSSGGTGRFAEATLNYTVTTLSTHTPDATFVEGTVDGTLSYR